MRIKMIGQSGTMAEDWTDGKTENDGDSRRLWTALDEGCARWRCRIVKIVQGF